jgi:hypothetical protein
VAEPPSQPYPPELVGTRLKLDRAYRHLQELHGEITAFLKLQPYRTALYKDEAGLEHVLVGYLTHWPPETLPLIIGDCMQNMRVALDHLAWALAGLSGVKPPRNTAFPIYLNPADFHDRTKKGAPTGRSGLKKIQAIPAEAQETIEELQPYHSEDPELDPLWVLNEYSRIDRHRTLSIVFAMSDYTSVDIGRRTESGGFVSDPDMVVDSVLSIGDFRHGGELFRFTLKEPDPNVEVRYDSPLYLALGKAYEATGEPVINLLENIHQHIAQEVLPRFERFLSDA